MDPLEGLPDFQYPLTSDWTMFAPFGKGSYALLPRQVNVALDAAGAPKFQLMLMKHAADTSAGSQYGVMDLSLAGEFPIDDALTAARKSVPDAMVARSAILSGFVRLYATNNAVTLPVEITTPIALGSAGSDFAEFTMRLPLDAAELIAGALSNHALLFGARLEYSVAGVAPRIPVFVQFEPAKLISAVTQGRANGQVAASDLLIAFTTLPTALPFVVVGTIDDPSLFGQAMADRIIAAYGSPVPSPDIAAPPFIALAPANQLDTATIQWDLSQPSAASRQWAMVLDPLTALQAAAQANGVASLVKQVEIPPLNLGFERIYFAAVLPGPRLGVPAIGVNVRIPANPPSRPAAESVSVMLTAPDDRGIADLRFAPGETVACTISTFAVVAPGHSIHPYKGTDRAISGNWVELQAGDFPVVFAVVTAEARLLALAGISGALRYTSNGKPLEQTFTLTAAAPGVALAMPAASTAGAAQDAALSVIASPSDGSAALTPVPTNVASTTGSRVHLDFNSFAEYGPHVVSITCGMSAGDPPLFVEFLPDAEIGDPAAIPAKFAFTPEQPGNRWGYVALSPFRCGYRFRPAAAGSDAPKPWSTVQSPFRALQLEAKGNVITVESPVGAPQGVAAG